MNWGHNIGLLRYGDKLRYHRKICQQNFGKEAVKHYHSVMLQKVHALLDGLLGSPERFEQHSKMYAALIGL